jgi:hypothetical protein
MVAKIALKFKIDRIVNYLEKYKKGFDDIYKWNPKLEGVNIFSIEEIDALNKLKENPFKKRLLLQEFISKKLNSYVSTQNNKQFNDLSLWVIKDWGGINSSKDEDTCILIDKIYQEEKASFNRIASTSKVLAFLNPEKYIIYDSRVAYALNWIILKEDAGDKFFPIPEGRNSKMSAFDLNVLIRLKNIKNYQPNIENKLDKKLYINDLDANIFIPKSEAYFELNKLIKSVNEGLWTGDNEKINRLYFTEMLLFSIADKAIFEDITKTLTLNFNDQ